MKPWVKALLGAAMCRAFASAEAQEIRISHHYDDTADARGRATRVFVDEAQKLAPDLKFRIYPKLSLGLTSVGQLDALQSQGVRWHSCRFPTRRRKSRKPRSHCFPDWSRASSWHKKLKSTELYNKLQEIAQANGVRIITWWWSPGGFATKARPITGPESVAGLRMRAADPIFERMLQAAGAQRRRSRCRPCVQPSSRGHWMDC